jgi:NADPH:quinone reductase-like Zn-dependent oxidoreductase
MTTPITPPMTTPTNTAAWIPGKHVALQVGPTPYTRPGDHEIVVRNHAVAVNPLDWIIQVDGSLTYGWLKYPTVLGTDVAGEVVEVGGSVTGFRAGDRVIGHAVGSDKDTNQPAQGAFQHYTVLLETMACPIPDTLSFQDAAVLPLAVSTAACGLFQSDHLALRHPSASPDPEHREPTGQTVLVWGGSTSVGSNAIQLAVAAGYEVITTASPRNFDYVRSLGADQVFDYNSPSAVSDIIAAFQGRTLAGAIAFGTTSARSCIRVVRSCRGKKFVSMATPPVSFDVLAAENRGRLALPRLLARLIGTNIAVQAAARTGGVRTKYIFGSTLKNNEVGPAIYRDYLPAALAEGRHLAVPPPMVVGKSLEDLQHAMDTQRRGVSATKVVVTLP